MRVTLTLTLLLLLLGRTQAEARARTTAQELPLPARPGGPAALRWSNARAPNPQLVLQEPGERGWPVARPLMRKRASQNRLRVMRVPREASALSCAGQLPATRSPNQTTARAGQSRAHRPCWPQSDHRQLDPMSLLLARHQRPQRSARRQRRL